MEANGCKRVTGFRRTPARGARPGLPLIVMAIAVVPALAGCSAFSSPSPSPPPPHVPAAAAAPAAPNSPAVASASPPAGQQPTYVPGYPTVSLTDLFRSDDDTAQQKPGVPHPPSTYYPANGAPVAGQPGTATAAAPSNPPQYVPGYPTVSLTDLFKSDSTPQAQTNVPHPPPTYTPSTQQGSAPPPAPAAPAATDTAASGPYPSQSIFDLFKNNSGGQ